MQVVGAELWSGTGVMQQSGERGALRWHTGAQEHCLRSGRNVASMTHAPILPQSIRTRHSHRPTIGPQAAAPTVRLLKALRASGSPGLGAPATPCSPGSCPSAALPSSFHPSRACPAPAPGVASSSICCAWSAA